MRSVFEIEQRTYAAKRMIAFVLIFGMLSSAWAEQEVLIGNTAPYSGPAVAYSAIAKAEGAYFEKINSEKIFSKKIRFISVDDGYAPPKALEQARKLVEQENVLFFSGNIGSAPNTGSWSYINEKKVPDLFIGSGVTSFDDPAGHPWVIKMFPSYEAEGRAFGIYVLKNVKDPKIAVLYQNDPFGKDYLKGFKEALGDKAKSLIVGEENYQLTDPTQDSQIIKLKSTGANVFFDISAGKATAQVIKKIASLGWKPAHLVPSISASIKSALAPAGLEASKDIISLYYYKSPTDPRWVDDSAMKEHKEFMKKYLPDGNAGDDLPVIGVLMAQATLAVLKSCGDDFSRENIISKATSISNLSLPLLMPGVKLSVSKTDYNAIKQLQPMKFNGEKWVSFGDLIDLSSKQ